MINIREAIIAAAENVGSRWAKKLRRKQNGMVSFLEHLAESHTREFVKLLAHVLRDQQPDEPREDVVAPPQSLRNCARWRATVACPTAYFRRRSRRGADAGALFRDHRGFEVGIADLTIFSAPRIRRLPPGGKHS